MVYPWTCIHDTFQNQYKPFMYLIHYPSFKPALKEKKNRYFTQIYFSPLKYSNSQMQVKNYLLILYFHTENESLFS